MTRSLFPTLLVCLPALVRPEARAALDRPWQQVTTPTAAAAAPVFAEPPPEYGAQFTWGWKGPVDAASIVRDLDGMKALGVHAAIIDPGSGMKERYLSRGYFELVKFAVAEAKKRNMRLWLMDDGDYPSGMAGGKLTAERPELGMQALAATEKILLSGGTHWVHPADSDLICTVAVNRASGEEIILEPTRGQLEWTVPAGSWEVRLSRHVFRTSPTRAAYNETGAKDTKYSLVDYLNPDATKVYIDWTFEGYREAVGDEFGKTVLGFRGDEPAYAFNPWSPALLAEFQQRKGYDLRPFLGAIGAASERRESDLSAEERLAYADYCDVWSDLFSENYFTKEGEWCAAHGVEMQLHIEHEEVLPQLAASNGDYFKAFSAIEVPGIDTIWHQIWMDNPADFPKLASSAAHLNGHPRAMCEAFAAYRPPPNLTQATWILNFLLVHGINRIEYMFYPSSAARAPRRPETGAPWTGGSGERPPGPGGIARYYRDPGFPAVAAYVDRLSYILGEGRPAADIALLVPSSSFWVGDAAEAARINASFLKIAHTLITDQRDFDFVDDHSLATGLELKDGVFTNRSGQAYRAVVVPPSLSISQRALDRLQAFARQGGHVIFLGEPPGKVIHRTFLHAQGRPALSWATLAQVSEELTDDVLARLPPPDLRLAAAHPLVSYLHRRLGDSEIYFIFNSAPDAVSTKVTLAGRGLPQRWDPATGAVFAMSGWESSRDSVTLPLALKGGETLLVSIGPSQP